MNKQYEIKYENKSIFFNGNLDYLFNALHDDKEPKGNTGDDIISLANFISSEDHENMEKGGDLKRNLKLKINQRILEVDPRNHLLLHKS